MTPPEGVPPERWENCFLSGGQAFRQEVVRAIRRKWWLCCRSARPSGSMKYQGREPETGKE